MGAFLNYKIFKICEIRKKKAWLLLKERNKKYKREERFDG